MIVRLCKESNGEVDYDQGPREYIDSSLGTIRDIKIQQLNSGYLITVGCQTIAIETASKLSSALNSYIMSPVNLSENGFQLKKLTNLKIYNKIVALSY
jgi:hypothetical protein